MSGERAAHHDPASLPVGRGAWLWAAKRREVVRLPDGRPGRLVFVAPHGQEARIALPNQVMKTVNLDELTLIEGEPTHA